MRRRTSDARAHRTKSVYREANKAEKLSPANWRWYRLLPPHTQLLQVTTPPSAIIAMEWAQYFAPIMRREAPDSLRHAIDGHSCPPKSSYAAAVHNRVAAHRNFDSISRDRRQCKAPDASGRARHVECCRAAIGIPYARASAILYRQLSSVLIIRITIWLLSKHIYVGIIPNSRRLIFAYSTERFKKCAGRYATLCCCSDKCSQLS